ncbi:hypothetical protein M2350_001023 [Candidatus Fervidibacter sacchari]|uniref:Uncharacterized protein n=1 Tax=Candidatus Fervidibacter sacchari TaxID=1448929 RepID=A0ABT2EL09_9BACT|nr:hypothetical protein [Candidatus Fervidibacter sacchari]
MQDTRILGFTAILLAVISLLFLLLVLEPTLLPL